MPNLDLFNYLFLLLRYAWIPQSIVLLILAGSAGPKFDIYSPSTVTGTTLAGNRLTFFSICLSSAITYAPGAADFLVYCDPKIASRWKVFGATLTGLTLSFIFTFVLGTGLSSGLQNDPVWAAAGAGTGALVVAGYDDLGRFGKFCSVIAALGLIANMVPPTYSSGIDFQILGRYPAAVPRYLWNTLAVIIFAVCALAGRNSLSAIFTNFLALMGYCKNSLPNSSCLTKTLPRGCSLDCYHSRRRVHFPPKDEAQIRLEQLEQEREIASRNSSYDSVLYWLGWSSALHGSVLLHRPTCETDWTIRR